MIKQQQTDHNLENQKMGMAKMGDHPACKDQGLGKLGYGLGRRKFILR